MKCKKCHTDTKDTSLCLPCYYAQNNKTQWSEESKPLIEWAYWYINKLSITRPYYENIIQGIERGPCETSGELLKVIKRMKELVDQELKQNPAKWPEFL